MVMIMNEEEIKQGLKIINEKYKCRIEFLTDGVVSLEYTNDDTVFKAVIGEAVKNLKDKFNGGSNE